MFHRKSKYLQPLKQRIGRNYVRNYLNQTQRIRTLTQGLIGTPLSQLVLQYLNNDYYIWTRIGSTTEWLRTRLKLDTGAFNTGMFGIKEHIVYDVKAWVPFANTDSNTVHSGTATHWVSNISGSNTNFGLNFYVIDTSVQHYVEIQATNSGDLYVAMVVGNDRGYTYITINGSTTLVNGPDVGTSGGNKYIDTYSPTQSLKVFKIATGLSNAAYTLRLTQSTTEKNASSSNYRMFPDSYAFAGAASGLPFYGSTVTIEGDAIRCLTSISGTFVSRTGANVNNWTAMTIPALTDATPDYLYFGSSIQFNKISMTFSAANTNGGTMAMQYWNGSAWTTLTITDGTSSMSASGAITWTAPSNWATTSVNSITAYWVRCSWTGNTGGATTSMTTTSATMGAVNNGTSLFTGVANGSQLEYAWAFTCPNPNNTVQTVGGELHGGELNTGTTVVVDGVTQSLTNGQTVVGQSIVFTQNMNTVHSTAGTVASGTLKHTFGFNTNTVQIDYQITVSFAAGITITSTPNNMTMYPATFWQGGAKFSFLKARLFQPKSKTDIDFHTAGKNAASGQIKASGVLYSSTQSPYFCAVTHQSSIAQNFNWSNSVKNVWVNVNPTSQTVAGYSIGPGTLSVTNGSTAVVGTGTTFSSGYTDAYGNVIGSYSLNDYLLVNGNIPQVSSVTDDTHLTLKANYAGSTASGVQYWYSPTYQSSAIAKYYEESLGTGTIAKPLSSTLQTSNYYTFGRAPYTRAAGTVTLTNNSATLTGSGTAFTALPTNAILLINGSTYGVSSVTNDTSLTLTEFYSGTTTAGLSLDYQKLPTDLII